MAQGVREVTIKRGYDPREFALIAAGGAGPMHSCLICSELEIPVQIVPACASVMCAYGMLLSELQHDFVRTFIARLQSLDWERLAGVLGDMRREGDRLLDQEQVPRTGAASASALIAGIPSSTMRSLSMCPTRQSRNATARPSRAHSTRSTTGFTDTAWKRSRNAD